MNRCPKCRKNVQHPIHSTCKRCSNCWPMWQGHVMAHPSRSILLGGLVLLALATSASAECAWVLWLNHTGVVTGEEIDLWIPLHASTDNPNCQQVLAATLQANSRPANPGDLVTLRASNTIDVVTTAGPHTLVYVCLPDTVDPRGPRGTN
jgi:hypothetical protein